MFDVVAWGCDIAGVSYLPVITCTLCYVKQAQSVLNYDNKGHPTTPIVL